MVLSCSEHAVRLSLDPPRKSGKTTTPDIAQAAGVPVGNAYYYFKIKDELLGAALDADADELAVALVAAYQGISLLTNTFRDPGS